MHRVTEHSQSKSSTQVPGLELDRIQSDEDGSGFFSFWQDGNAIKVTRPIKDHYANQRLGGGTRKDISEFSKKSRRALMKSINQTSRKKNLIVITLTYPEVMTDGNQAKRNLHAFLEWMRRNYPNVAGFWKIELQTRGSIHFHFLCFANWIPWCHVAAAWDRIIGNECTVQLSASTEVRGARIRERARRYLFAYLGKHEGKEELRAINHIGRFWGAFNRDKLPVSALTTIRANNEVCTKFCEFWSERFGHEWTLVSVTLFITDEQAEWIEQIISSFN